MTSHRAMVTVPAQEDRGPQAGHETSSPPALPVAARASHGPAPAARPPARVAAPGPSGADEPVDAQRYLAPALKAAAAARARTAQIRAVASVAAAGAARPRQWLLPAPDHLPTALTLPPMPTPDPKLAAMMAAWTVHGLSVAPDAEPLPALPPSPATPASRGLSVAEAAGAARIAFRPLRRDPPVRPAAPAGSPRPPADAPNPTPAGKAAAPVGRATLPATAVAEVAVPTAPLKTVTCAAPSGPATLVTRPGAARLLPGEAVRRVVPERPARQQRFAKTIAELQRHQAATRPNEPWGNVVPRPAVPQSNPANSDSRWSRLWSRR